MPVFFKMSFFCANHNGSTEATRGCRRMSQVFWRVDQRVCVCIFCKFIVGVAAGLGAVPVQYAILPSEQTPGPKDTRSRQCYVTDILPILFNYPFACFMSWPFFEI